MSDPRYTEPRQTDPRYTNSRDPARLNTLNAPPRRNSGIITGIVVALLIVGGIFYWTGGSSTHIASNSVPGSTTTIPIAPVTPTTPAPVAHP